MKNKINVLKFIKNVSIIIFIMSMIVSVNALLENDALSLVFKILNVVAGAFAINAFIGTFDNE